jgi:hypothetical protein
MSASNIIHDRTFKKKIAQCLPRTLYLIELVYKDSTISALKNKLSVTYLCSLENLSAHCWKKWKKTTFTSCGKMFYTC